MRIGYACINLSLPGVTTNRTMIAKTFNLKGPDYVSELAILNIKDLLTILKWNVKNGIKFFRVSSDLIPRGDLVDIEQLKDFDKISSLLLTVGRYAIDNDIRLTFHPGPFNVLGSPNQNVVDNTIKNLEMHGKIFDLMGLSQTPYNKINIHCNGTYGDKEATMKRFAERFNLLSNSVKSRLTLENDDKASMYSVADLMYLYNLTKIPIVFDYHHHQFCTGDLSEKEALELAMTTWPIGITPVAHYSESKAINENLKVKMTAHSDYIHNLPNVYENDIDIMVEAKAKNLAIQKFLN